MIYCTQGKFFDEDEDDDNNMPPVLLPAVPSFFPRLSLSSLPSSHPARPCSLKSHPPHPKNETLRTRRFSVSKQLKKRVILSSCFKLSLRVSRRLVSRQRSPVDTRLRIEELSSRSQKVDGIYPHPWSLIPNSFIHSRKNRDNRIWSHREVVHVVAKMLQLLN